jgi:uncharacterized protein YndB with AHSA1/START domain
MSTTDTTSLRLERTFDATADEVFDAWTNPEVLRRWWGASPTWLVPVAEVDLRVGGHYRLSMEDPDTGAVHTVRGEYREVQRPGRLVYSWCWEEGGGGTGHESTVTVEFLGDGERTKVVLLHTDLASAESRDQHGAGWNGCFDNLQSRIFPGVQESRQAST